MASELELNDKRGEFIGDYVLKSLKQKSDKFLKLWNTDETKQMMLDFFEKPEIQHLFVLQAPGGGALNLQNEFPTNLKSKACFFTKKAKESISRDAAFNKVLIFGDISYTPLDQFSSFVDEVILPVLSNAKNQESWPSVISSDVIRHTNSLKHQTDVVLGQSKGKTLLPLPVGSEKVSEGDINSFGEVPRSIIYAIETVVIEWAHQIDDVLSKQSSEQLMAGLNPTPFVELDYWKTRSFNLECIYEQLASPKVKKMATLLEYVDSTYAPPFKHIFKSVVAALKESQNINLYLAPLRNQLEEIEQVEFSEMEPMIDPLFHVLCLIWAHCKDYRVPERIVVLAQEISNLIINCCHSYLDPKEIFKGETEEALEKVERSLKILNQFKESFESHREKVQEYFKDGAEPVEWQFASNLIFGRLNSFMSRIEIVKWILNATLEFNKLEKVEISGIKGRNLSQNIVDMFEEFKNIFKGFTEQTYDCLDPLETDFLQDYHKFKASIDDLDRRLATTVSQAFADCHCYDAVFKLIDIFGGLLDRPILKLEFDKRYFELVKMLDEEMENDKLVYDIHVSDNEKVPKIHKNMPKVTGELEWCKEMRERIKHPLTLASHLDHQAFKTTEFNLVVKKHDELLELLKKHEMKYYNNWLTGVDETCSFNLSQPLLIRNMDTMFISVNFDTKLQAVLREVKYLKILDQEEIPQSATDIHSKNDTLRKYINNLDLMVEWYNYLRKNTLTVEQPLIENELNQIDEQLEKAITNLCWNSDGAWQYIEQVRDLVHNLRSRVVKSKENIDTIRIIMSNWQKSPLFERKEGKYDTLLNLDDREDRCNKRYKEITEAGERVHGLVKENSELLKADSVSEHWKQYVDNIDDMIVENFQETINYSLQYIIDQIEGSKDPLFEVSMDLQGNEIVFQPSLDRDYADNFSELVDSLVTDIFKQASKVKRLAIGSSMEDYRTDLEENEELQKKRNEISERTEVATEKAKLYQAKFDEYSNLWTDNREEFMSQFLRYGQAISAEELEAHGEQDISAFEERPPTLDQFKHQIDKYEKQFEEIEKMNGFNIIDKWFRIDCRKFKQAFLNTIKRWSLMFKQHLIDHVTNSLKELAEFIKITNSGLNKEAAEGDFEGLVEMMGHLGNVKERQQATDEMFEPLKQTIDLLKTYNQEMPDEVHLQLEELPEKWNNTKKVAVTVKQTVAPLQNQEVANIRRKCATFDVKQHTFREQFRKMDPFNFSCLEHYEDLDRKHIEISGLEKAMEELNESAALFEVNVPEFKQLKQCRKELRLLKILWDHINVVNSSIEVWKKTLWKDINVEQMDQDCKSFAKSIRSLDKEMRSWDAYTGVEDQIKNMMTSLRAVNELQNPAIRDRHWAQLMAATKVKFDMNESTTLEDLLKLNLHNFEDEVRSIVEKAVKEMSMEKVLKELYSTWSQMEFEHEKHSRTGITLLKASEELIETLEEDQVKLQNMMTSKYISHFYDEVFSWQKTLSTADQVIQIWFEVQRTWSHLESIFIGSDDIRKQLPEDSERFDRIDTDFKALVTEVEETTNVVKATGKPRLYERLEVVQSELVLCEKALAEYLETKRLAFPRFYFVSSADLLDILSNGNSPEIVMKHLTKLFDSLAKLKFLKEAEEENTKVGVAMYAKDGEMVEFTNNCDLGGQVETWLNRLLEEMRTTMRTVLSESVSSVEEKSRDQWIFEFPAQVALSSSQIAWGTEVYLSFARLEEGYENALKDFNKKQITQLNALITLLIGELSKDDRQKVMTICTIDVHNRDVVQKLITQKIDNSQSFTWLCQLRHRWADTDKDCYINICDAQFRYAHEYLGNTPRLVITPLTDRCYITLTQSLHLTMSGAPAGPAGTGKTETTKDLGRALGIMVYVFNCSEQMDYKSIGNIYKGLAQSGSWGCFDEFNRISVEVLSVVAVQVKCIQDAIKNKRKRFDFLGEEISLDSAIGIFITMNPGYAGRTELPENLKALFRPCAMVVPDFELICEIMLVAEGFLQARILARKFITLYQLCKELLSKQDHYDWGLRAIKSVLVVAGALKRSDPDRPEDQVLMRALRDFNIPKIVTDDTPVFMGLIGDLFPALDVPRKRDPEFEKHVRQATLDLKLQAEENFVLKVVQLQELFAVRHSVFVLGNAGTGKSMVWKTLIKTYSNLKKKPLAVDLNPKAVTNDELFGIINPSTREWKDGLFSVIMRDLANLTSDGPKWIVLDGDIDPMWIESLNTVMDDNKVLTLASNERIPLTPTMRLLFEISHLKTATPATVSRAGILYINPQDLGWQPFVNSWISTREIQSEQANLTILFDKYVPVCLEALKLRFKKITPIVEISHVQMLCHLLEVLLVPENTPADCPKEWYELYFVFCAIWAFGSCMFQDQLVDHRVEFTKWWVTEFKTIKLPAQGTVFDYYIDTETKKFEPWTKRMTKFEMDLEQPLQLEEEMATICLETKPPDRGQQDDKVTSMRVIVNNLISEAVLVPTSETTRFRYFLDLLIEKRRPVMLVGGAGTGKTVLLQDKLNSIGDNYVVANVPFNFYTTSEMLQRVLEKPLEKKAGRNYGPSGSKKLIYFIDDMNMPEVDKYFTVQPHTLIRQHIDYSHWYDRAKLTLKEIHNTQYLACMNPTAGSFTISPRLQRHFCVFALSFPGQESLKAIYSTILSEKLGSNFSASLLKTVSNLVDLALNFHNKINSTFLPTAIKFHYVFNLRDLSNIFQGILFAGPDCIKQPSDLVRLWMHEGERVYNDKLIDDNDIETYQRLQKELTKKAFEEMDEMVMFKKPLLYCHFAQGIGEPKYMPVERSEDLSKILKEALESYNEVNAAMNLVLFEDAVAHILRINRILESPRGYALLVGVGGSGKQSLSRLAAFISSLDVFQITLRKGYGINDLKLDLAALYMKAGVKNIGVVFLLTDAQIADEKFLVLVNDLLASGEILDLFPDDEMENIISSMRNEVKSTGMIDSRENCWAFFINKVRSTLRLVLCFSPVGSTLRVRARKFPAVVNCTSIDWFHEWPEDALISVSHRFLQEVELLPEDYKDSTAKFMSFVHKAVNKVSISYLQNERRYNYTTPKSFLEQIALYSNMLKKKHTELQGKMSRLENGLQKLESTAQQVDDLKAKLAAQEVELEQKNASANELLEKVATDTKKVSSEKRIADVEEEKVSKIKAEVSKKQQDCERDLAKAEPALQAAQEALNTLNKNNLTEMKSFGTPPPAVIDVSAACMCLMATNGKVPKDRSWKAAKAGIMGKIDAFLDNLINYNKDNIPEPSLKAAKEYCKDPNFNPEEIKSKSLAAAGLCSWVINIITYYEIFCDVKPKRDALEAANEELREATEKLSGIQNKIKQLEDQLQKLQDEFEKARSDKQRCQDEADLTYKTIELANRLVGGLASENVRWGKQVEQYKIEEKTLPGDVLVTVAFLSYVGCFTKPYRLTLMDTYWLPFLANLTPIIPITQNLDPLKMLVDDAIIASWNNEGLPSDRMSIENATILTNAERWPLIIDPQLQGIKWIKTRHGADLKVVRLGQKGYLDVIEQAVSAGDVVLIENIEESMDPVLDHLLGRNTIKKGRAIKLGDKECEYNPEFRLILQTKLANPHYKPEMQAQTTIINFTVTRDGLEDQLLATVVNKERSDLETLKLDLTKQQNQFKITLKELEDSLLHRLSAAEGNFLGDYALVENLENNKRTAIEIEEKVEQAKITEVTINETRELYRPAAARASMLYFILNDLNKINPMYQFSLKAFRVVFEKAIDRAEPSEELKGRVENLIDSITFSVYLYTSRGLFEKDKLIFTAQMSFQILLGTKEINPFELDFLLRFPIVPNLTSPIDFLSNNSWGGIKALSALEEFKNLDRDIEGSAKRWKKFVESETPEKEKFPQEWKNKTSLQRLCMMRALRPDRMTYAVADFVDEKLGHKYVEGGGVEFSQSFEESGPATPIFFILSPGVDPLKDVETLGKKLGFSGDNKNFRNISLGQGQEIVAEKAMDLGAKEGHWVVLQNIHLVSKWLSALEKKLEEYAEESHESYRVFISAEPSGSPESHIIPQGILENAIKITNEPPTGMLANLHKSLNNFNQETMEMCAKENEFKTILFALCYFHAVVSERRKFGPQGWNRSYPFNTGDLAISVNVLYNYLEANSKVPWEDLRYLFGEIMYGGHITDDWDRKLCKTYLEEYLQPEMLDGELNIVPGFKVPPNTDYKGYHNYIDECLPAESPYLYGLHPNAEIEFLTSISDKLFKTVFEMQPRDSSGAGATGISREERIKQILDDIMEKLPDDFNMVEIQAKVPPEERNPYVVVAFQECERMNMLTSEIRRSLKELDLGLKGELTITADMEALSNSLYMDVIPESWSKRAYPSLYGLALWYADLLLRIKELEIWTTDFQLPSVIWLGGLFNPQSFLTAIMQQMARKNEWPLDRMALQCDVTKKNKEDMGGPPRDGAYVHGLFMEGARWDTQSGMIAEAKLKELGPSMPVIFIKAIPVDRQDLRNVYACPVYKTKERGPTFVWTFNLKTKEKPSKWVLGGVALLLQV